MGALRGAVVFFHRTMSSVSFHKNLLPSDHGPTVMVNKALVMGGGNPTVAWSFRMEKLKHHIQTLEYHAGRDDQFARAIEPLLCELLAAHAKHEEQHNAAITEAPTAEDLQDYLASYAAAIGQGDF